MKFTILAVGKLKTAYLRDGVAEFVKRLTVYGGVTITELNESKLPSADDSKRQAIVAEEGERLLKQVNPKSYVVLLDVKGKTMSSEALAEKIADLEVQGISEMTFYYRRCFRRIGSFADKGRFQIIIQPHDVYSSNGAPFVGRTNLSGL